MNKEALIEKYFSHQLSEEEFKQLEQVLQENAEWREEFYNELALKNVIAQKNHEYLKNRLQELDEKPAKRKPWYLYAAAIVILIAIGSFFFDAAPDYQKLYAHNFEVFPNVVTITTRSNEQVENDETIAFTLYDTKKFNQAAITFHDLFEKKNKDYLKFYEGISLLAANKTLKGIKVLESHNWKSKQSDFAIPAYWYLGLSYMKLENTTESKKYFKIVAHSENQLNESAQKILEKLN